MAGLRSGAAVPCVEHWATGFYAGGQSSNFRGGSGSPHDSDLLRGKTLRYPTLSVLVVSALMSLISSPSLHAADPDTQGVHAALTAYHQALNKVFTGDAAPIKTLWSHADDVTYMDPAGGMLHG